MQTYDVYLKRRLTEIDTIITQLVQHDSFAIYNWLTLFATMDEVIRKALKVESAMVHDTSLKDFLEYAYEKMNSKMYLYVKTGLLCQVSVEGETEITLSANEIGILEKSFIGSNSPIEISVLPLNYIAHVFGKVEFGTKMFMSGLKTLKYSLEKFENQFVLSSDIGVSSQKRTNAEESSIFLDIAFADILYLFNIVCNAVANLHTPPLDECVLKKILHDLNVRLTLTAITDETWRLTKIFGMEDMLNIFSEIIETMIKCILPATTDTVLSCEASIGLKRHRKLKELKDKKLCDFSQNVLWDFCYVTIAD